MIEIPRWAVFETGAESARESVDPFWDTDVCCELTAPSGAKHTVDAFWDGGRAWRARFAPDEVGEWSWRLRCAGSDAVLDAQAGAFRCVPYEGDNPLYAHGPVEVSESGRHFQHVDGEPFFWLGDTAWNGVLRARPADWERYLAARRAQRFTAIQFVSTQWRGGTALLGGGLAFTGTERIAIAPSFFQRLDPKVAAINAHGLVAAPVMLWALWESDPGQVLSEQSAIRLARYLAARWGAYHVIWFLGGDGRYKQDRAERWKRIGRAVFGTRHDRLVTMHPCGQSWVGPEFRGEPWFDFIGYQSGHGSSDEHLRWLVNGPPASAWGNEPVLPVVNLEPNYEAHPSYHIARAFTDREVRRAAYWSLLVSPPAGVSFGHNSIWVWPEGLEVPEGHDRIGPVGRWEAGLDTPGIRSMTVLRALIDRLPWTDMRPLPALVREQPGDADPARYCAAAATADGRVAAVYMPVGGPLSLDLDLLAAPGKAEWFDPRTGAWTPAPLQPAMVAPDDGDWVLVVA
ncbi:MAG: DUF4038 domain-containing protein [Anaerolineae bacterium]|nr:DUF4038 domain-containing protein [Anaerolineae bacterium]